MRSLDGRVARLARRWAAAAVPVSVFWPAEELPRDENGAVVFNHDTVVRRLMAQLTGDEIDKVCALSVADMERGEFGDCGPTLDRLVALLEEAYGKSWWSAVKAGGGRRR